MSDQVIGSVKVRVVPDTSRFAKQAKVKLEREEQKLPKLKVEFEVDDRSLRTEAKRAVRELNLWLRANEKVQFRAEISTLGMKSAVKKAVRELNVLAANEKVSIRGESLATTIEAELDKASLTAMNAELNAYIKRISPKRVFVTPLLTPGAGTKMDAQLTKLTRPREAVIKPKLDGDNKVLKSALDALMKFSGARLGVGIFNHFRDFFKDIDKKVPLIGGLTLAILGLSGSMLSAVGNTFSLSRALAQIGPGVVALPGLFVGMGIGLAATVAVFKDFNKELPGVSKALGKIQDSMSAKFWNRARKPIQDMFNVLLPKFARGLDKTALALGTFFSNLANSFRREFAGDAIANMFKDLNESIREMSKHTDSIARLFRILGEAGAGRLPELSRWIGRLIDDFADFLAKAEKAGDITRWVDTAVARIKSLGNVLKNAGKLFAGLARAADNASPGNALDTLSDALGRAQKVVNSSSFQRKLTGVLVAAHEMMERISKKSGPAFKRYWSNMADTLIEVLPIVGNTIGILADGIFSFLGSPAIQTGLKRMVSSFERAVKKLRPVFEILAQKSGAVMELVGAMAVTFSGVFAASVETLTPILTTFLKVLTQLVELLGLIPAPILQMVIAMSAANRILGGFSLASAAVKTSMGGMVRDLGTVSAAWINQGTTAKHAGSDAKLASDRLKTSLSGLKGMAQAAAGGAGLLLLSKSANETDDSMKTLEQSAAGAAIGFSVGGPLGAAIGGIGGLLYNLISPTKNVTSQTEIAEQAARDAAGTWQDYSAALDAVTGSINDQVRVIAAKNLSDSGALAQAQKLKISTELLTDASLGNEDALAKVATALAKAIIPGDTYSDGMSTAALNSWHMSEAAKSLQEKLNIVSGSIDTASGKIQEAGIASGEFRKSLDGLSKAAKNKIIARIETSGWPKTKAELAALFKGIKLTPPQVKTVFKALGITPTTKDIQRVIDKLKETEKVKPDLKGYKDGVKGGADKAAAEGDKGGKKVGDKLTSPLKTLKANLLPFSKSIKVGINTPKGVARDGGKGIGDNLTSGLAVAILNGNSVVSAAGRAIIAEALRAMREEADIHSPSRKTRTIGDQMLQGLIRGLSSKPGSLGRATASIIRAMLKGLTGSEAAAMERALNKLADKVPKDASKKFKRHLGEMRNDMLRLINAWQSAADQIKSKMDEIKNAAGDFSVQVAEAVHALGDPTAIELGDGQALTFELITKNMADAIEKAKKWAAALIELKRLGLNNTMFTQIMSAGPAAGLAAAEAIAAAGQAGVDAINEQQAQLQKIAEEAAKIAYDQHYANGLAMAQGLLDGLKAKQAELLKQMKALGAAMVAAIKHELGIKSPSRVMREVGGYTGEGFVLGVQDTHRDAERAIEGLSLVRPRRLSVDRFLAPSDGSGVTESPATIQIDNLTIPLEDLAQLRSLEEFLELLRVRTRQGV